MSVRLERRRPPRGYLLLEVLVAGGLAATVLVGTLVVSVGLRNNSVLAAKKGLAASLASRRIAQAGSVGYTALNANNGLFGAADTVDSKKYENGTDYTVTTTVSCSVPTSTINGESFDVGVCDVGVSVSFDHEGASIVRGDALRLYDPEYEP